MVSDAYAVFLLLWPQSGKTQVLTPQWTDPFSVFFERLGQGMGKDKKYVRPADPPIISRVKENEKNNARRLLQQIDAGADLEVRDAAGYTALMCGAAEGKGTIAWILLGAGACINAGTSDGKTALMRAAIYGLANMVRFFLEREVNVEAKKASGGTALSRARDRRLWNMGGKQHVQVVALLTQAGTSQRAVR